MNLGQSKPVIGFIHHRKTSFFVSLSYLCIQLKVDTKFRNQQWIIDIQLTQIHRFSRKIHHSFSSIKFPVFSETSKIKTNTLETWIYTLLIPVCIIYVFVAITKAYSLFAIIINMFQHCILWGLKIHCGNSCFLLSIPLYFDCINIGTQIAFPNTYCFRIYLFHQIAFLLRSVHRGYTIHLGGLFVFTLRTPLMFHPLLIYF